MNRLLYLLIIILFVTIVYQNISKIYQFHYSWNAIQIPVTDVLLVASKQISNYLFHNIFPVFYKGIFLLLVKTFGMVLIFSIQKLNSNLNPYLPMFFGILTFLRNKMSFYVQFICYGMIGLTV